MSSCIACGEMILGDGTEDADFSLLCDSCKHEDPVDLGLSDQNIHVVPTDDFQEHKDSSDCWCQPVMIERVANTGIEVWSHNRAKDSVQ